MFMQNYADQTYALLRIVAGFLFFAHGGQKIFGLFGGFAGGELPPLLWAAGLIEVIGGLLIIIGYFTHWAAFICSGQMAAAYFMGHFMNEGHFWPIQNRGELAVLYCFLFLFVAAKGAGIWSVDKSVGRT